MANTSAYAQEIVRGLSAVMAVASASQSAVASHHVNALLRLGVIAAELLEEELCGLDGHLSESVGADLH